MFRKERWFGGGSIGGKTRRAQMRPGTTVVAAQPFLEGTPGRLIAKPSPLARAAIAAKEADLMMSYASGSACAPMQSGADELHSSPACFGPEAAASHCEGEAAVCGYGPASFGPGGALPGHVQQASGSHVSTLDRLHALRAALEPDAAQSPGGQRRELSILYDPSPRLEVVESEREAECGESEPVRGQCDFDRLVCVPAACGSVDHVNTMRPHGAPHAQFTSSPNLLPGPSAVDTSKGQERHAAVVGPAQTAQSSGSGAAVHFEAQVARYQQACANFPVTVDQVLPGLNAQPIPHWLRIYSCASPQLDSTIHWDLFQLSQLDYFNECLLKLYKQDVVQCVLAYEAYRTALLIEVHARKGRGNQAKDGGRHALKSTASNMELGSVAAAAHGQAVAHSDCDISRGVWSAAALERDADSAALANRANNGDGTVTLHIAGPSVD